MEPRPPLGGVPQLTPGTETGPRDAGEYRDRLGRLIGLDADARRHRARRAGLAAHTVSAHIDRIAARAAELTSNDISALRAIIGPIDHAEVYAAGVAAGVASGERSVARQVLAALSATAISVYADVATLRGDRLDNGSPEAAHVRLTAALARKATRRGVSRA